MDSLLADAARKLYAENLFETVRRCYFEANKDYLQKQIQIASEYLTDEQKDELREKGIVI
jgi:DNA-binding transcriptional regulator GbsR (MarR family)